MTSTTHVGFAARTAERFRYPDDPREIKLEISVAAAETLLDAINAHPDNLVEGSPAQQLEQALVAILREETP